MAVTAGRASGKGSRAMKKGVSAFLASALVIMLTILVSSIVANWVPQTSKDLTSSVEQQNLDQLTCTRGSFYVKNVTYNCSRTCAAGDKQHILNMTVENLGAISLQFSAVSIINTNGTLFTLTLNETKNLTIGETEVFENYTKASCAEINNSIGSVDIASNNCGNVLDSYPGSLVTYIECGLE